MEADSACEALCFFNQETKANFVKYVSFKRHALLKTLVIKPTCYKYLLQILLKYLLQILYHVDVLKITEVPASLCITYEWEVCVVSELWRPRNTRGSDTTCLLCVVFSKHRNDEWHFPSPLISYRLSATVSKICLCRVVLNQGFQICTIFNQHIFFVLEKLKRKGTKLKVYKANGCTSKNWVPTKKVQIWIQNTEINFPGKTKGCTKLDHIRTKL